MDMGRFSKNEVRWRMIGVYKWGWGEGSENTAFWGWVEGLMGRGNATASIVKGEIRQNSVLWRRRPGLVMESRSGCTVAESYEVKTSTKAVSGKTVVSGSWAKSVKPDRSFPAVLPPQATVKLSATPYTGGPARERAPVKTIVEKVSEKTVKG